MTFFLFQGFPCKLRVAYKNACNIWCGVQSVPQCSPTEVYIPHGIIQIADDDTQVAVTSHGAADILCKPYAKKDPRHITICAHDQQLWPVLSGHELAVLHRGEIVC